MKKILILVLTTVLILGLSISAYANLIVRGTDTLGYQMIYDTDLNITWYDYTNNLNTWHNQMNWVSALTVDFGGTIYTDWRLPTALNQDGTGPCVGYNCTGSEMGHLDYTELIGNSAGMGAHPSFTDGLTGDSESFQAFLNTEYMYWSGTEYAPNPDNAWYFGFQDAFQGEYTKDGLIGVSGAGNYAIAVRSGDVSAVPEPSTMLLFGSGLAGFGLLRKRFKS
jgi:hypothetical protein